MLCILVRVEIPSQGKNEVIIKIVKSHIAKDNYLKAEALLKLWSDFLGEINAFLYRHSRRLKKGKKQLGFEL